MKHNVNIETHTVFRDISNNLYVAIENKYIPLIQRVVRHFKRVEEVSDKNEVPGIYLQSKGDDIYHLEGDYIQNIKIKNLRY